MPPSNKFINYAAPPHGASSQRSQSSRPVVPAQVPGQQYAQPVPPVFHPQPPNNFELLERNISHNISISIHAILEAQTKLLMDHIHTTVDQRVSESEKRSDDAHKLLVQAMSNAHKIQLDSASKLMGKMKSIEPVVERVTNLDYCVQELLERLKDPEAALSETEAQSGPPKVVTHEMAVSPIKFPSNSQDDDSLGDITLVSSAPSMRRKAAKTRNAADPFIEASLSPATWSDTESQPRFHEASIFRPDLSLKGRKSYSIFAREPSPDGTISSLRRVSLGGDGLLESTIPSAADLPATPPASTTEDVQLLSVSPTPPSLSPAPQVQTLTSPAPDAEDELEERKPSTLAVTSMPSAAHLFDAPTPTSSVVDEQLVSSMMGHLDRSPSPLTPMNSPSPYHSPSPPPVIKKEVVQKAPLQREESVSARLRKRPQSQKASSSAPQSKRAKKPKVKHEVTMWPEDTKDTLTDLVLCDKCESWYHVGCLGIQEDDPRLEDGAEFVCPVCTDPKHHSRAIDVRGSNCSRPGCQIPVFVISHIIGSRHIAGGGGRRDEWLVKWYGYSTAEASWEQTSASLDLHIEHFKQRATQEGRDPDENPNDDILLKEALDAGFRHL